MRHVHGGFKRIQGTHSPSFHNIQLTNVDQSEFYATLILDALSACCRILIDPVLTDGGEDQWITALAAKLQPFCESLWMNREFVPMEPGTNLSENEGDDWVTEEPSLPIPAFFCLASMLKVYEASE